MWIASGSVGAFELTAAGTFWSTHVSPVLNIRSIAVSQQSNEVLASQWARSKRVETLSPPQVINLRVR